MKSQHHLGKILTALMSECDIDETFLSKQTGIPISTISRLCTNSDSNPTAHTLRPIAKFFDVSIDQLLGDESISPNRIPGTHIPQTFVSACLPVIEWEWIEDWSNGFIEKYKQNLMNWISTEKKTSEKAFALIVNTDSLGLCFRKNSLLIMEPEKKPKDGDMALIKVSKEEPIILKQIIIDGSEIYIKSVNPDIKTIKLLPPNSNFYGILLEIRYSLQEEIKNNNSEKLINKNIFNFSSGKLRECN